MNNDAHMKKLAQELANRSPAVVVTETSIFVVFALIALLGNSCVLYVFYKTRRLQTVTSYYLVALAVSDIAKSILIMPVTIAALACGRDVVNRAMGEALHWVSLEIITSSTAISLLIAINRYYCVNKPTKYGKYFRPKYAKLSLVLCGLIAMPFIVIGYTVEKPVIKFHSGWLLHVAWSPDQTLNTTFNVCFEFFMVVVPVSLLAYCYWKLYKRMANHIAAVAPSLTGANRSAISLEEANITRSLTAIVVACAFFWITGSIIYHLDSFVDLPRHIEMVYPYTSSLYSIVNPVLYNVFNKTFRREFARLFVCLKRTPRSSNQPLQVFKITAQTKTTKSLVNS